MVHLEAENGKEQSYFHRDNTLTECVICVKKCELEQMITNFLICFLVLPSYLSFVLVQLQVQVYHIIAFAFIFYVPLLTVLCRDNITCIIHVSGDWRTMGSHAL